MASRVVTDLKSLVDGKFKPSQVLGKRLFCESQIAVDTEDMNQVELAYSRRP